MLDILASRNTLCRHNSYLPSLQRKLLLAFQEADYFEFERILEKGVDSKQIDVNHYYEDPLNGTLLDIICKEKLVSPFIDCLIFYGADLNILNHQSHKAPIHIAVENTDIEALTALMQHPEKIDINIKDGNGDTALHIAAKLNKFDTIDLLFGHPKLDVNSINLANQTAMHFAFALNNMDTIHLLLDRCDIDLDIEDNDGRTCRQIILQNYSEIAGDIDDHEDLFHLVNPRSKEKFIKRARSNRCILDKDDGQSTYLQYACRMGLTDVAQVLLDLGVDPNKWCLTKPPLILAALYGHYEILDMLLQQPNISFEPVHGTNALHAVFSGLHLDDDSNEQHYDQYYNCLEMLLFETSTQCVPNKLYVNHANRDRDSILHRAARIPDDRFVRIILQHGAYIGQINNRDEQAIELIKPSIIEEFLNSCVTTNHKQSRDIDYALTFDYKMFVPSVQPTPSSNNSDKQATSDIPELTETGPLLKMSTLPEYRDLLRHPVITSFLHLKWQAIRIYYYLNFILNFAFLAFLVSYLYCICEHHKIDTLFGIVTLCLGGILCLRDLGQSIISPRTFIKSLENWLQASLHVMIILLFTYQSKSDVRPLATLAILISVIKSILLLQKHPMLATHVEIFKIFTLNFSKFLIWYGILISTFGFSFNILYKATSFTSGHVPDNSVSVFQSIITLITKFILDFVSFDKHPILSSFILSLSLSLIAIVLLALLNGLAVGDIQAIKADAETVAIVSKLNVISNYETINLRDTFANLNFSPKWQFFKNIFNFNVFPDLLPAAKAYVFPNQNNITIFQHHSPANQTESAKYAYSRFQGHRMDPQTVKASKLITYQIENSKRKTHIEERLENCSQQLRKHQSKFHSIEVAVQHNQNVSHQFCQLLQDTEASLHQCIDQMNKYSEKFNIFEQISDRNEKLLILIKRGILPLNSDELNDEKSADSPQSDNTTKRPFDSNTISKGSSSNTTNKGSTSKKHKFWK